MTKDVINYINNFNLYNYVTKGNTAYDWMRKFIPLEDTSLEGLVNFFSKYSDPSFSAGRNNTNNYNFREIYSKMINDLYMSLSEYPDGSVREIGDVERQRLLEGLRVVSNNKFESVEDYIEYVEDKVSINRYFSQKNEDPEFEAISNILIKKAISVEDPRAINEYRTKIISRIALPSILTLITKKVTTKDLTTDEDYLFCEALMEKFRSPDTLSRYDYFIEKVNDAMGKAKESVVFRANCLESREKFVKSELAVSLSDKDIERAQVKDELANIEEVLYDNSEVTDRFRVAYDFKRFKEPKVILDEQVLYGKTLDNGQHVYAVSYGKLRYSTMYRSSDSKPTYSSDALELIGITREGKDGIYQYFVYMPVSPYEIIPKSLARKNAEACRLKANGKKVKIVDSNSEEMVIVPRERIPQDLRKFYARTYFSDYNLTKTELLRSSYLPPLGRDEYNDPVVNTRSVTSYYDINAVNYAKTHGIAINNCVYKNMVDYIDKVLSKEQGEIIKEYKITKQKKSSDLDFIDIK